MFCQKNLAWDVTNGQSGYWKWLDIFQTPCKSCWSSNFLWLHPACILHFQVFQNRYCFQQIPSQVWSIYPRHLSHWIILKSHLSHSKCVQRQMSKFQTNLMQYRCEFNSYAMHNAGICSCLSPLTGCQVTSKLCHQFSRYSNLLDIRMEFY